MLGKVLVNLAFLKDEGLILPKKKEGERPPPPSPPQKNSAVLGNALCIELAP